MAECCVCEAVWSESPWALLVSDWYLWGWGVVEDSRLSAGRGEVVEAGYLPCYHGIVPNFRVLGFFKHPTMYSLCFSPAGVLALSV